jgi:CheY-like chemotaxis protein
MHVRALPERRLPVVLLIDDDLVSREVAATVLTMTGFTVHTAVDGNAALEMLAREVCRPGVILMDAQMPGLSGTKVDRRASRRTNGSHLCHQRQQRAA